MNDSTDKHAPEAVDAFIDRWTDTGGKERANYQLFLTELCQLLGHPGATTPGPEKPEDQLEAEEELLQRLVDLNHQRAAEEAKGKIRWLRPDYQAPEEAAQQGELDTDEAESPTSGRPGPEPGPSKKLPWPKTLQAQIRAVRDQLATNPMDLTTLASHYKRNPEKSITQVLEALSELGMVGQDEAGQYRNVQYRATGA